MRHTLSSGRRIRVIAEDLDGLWEEDRGLISFKSSLRGRRLLVTLLHELLHAECPNMPHAKVYGLSESIGRMVMALNKRGQSMVKSRKTSNG
jgi:hypothetical protein